MAILYVNDGGSNTTPFNTWAKAATTLATALADAACVPGSTVYVDSTHAGTYGTNKTYTNSGTVIAPIIVISVDATGSPEPPTNGDYLAGASEAATGGTYDLVFSGSIISHGVSYSAQDDIQIGGDSSATIYDATLELTGTASGDGIKALGGDSVIRCINCVFQFANAGQGLSSSKAGGFFLESCSLSGSGTAISALLNGIGIYGITFLADNCDFSNLATGGEVVSALGGLTALPVNIRASNCLLRSAATAATFTNATTTAPNAIVEAYNVSTGTDANAYFVVSEFGVAQNDNAIYLDTTNAFSLDLTTNGNAIESYKPLRCMLGEVYAAAGATIGIEGIIDRATIPDNDEFWIEAMYPDVTNVSDGQKATTQSTILATPAAYSAGTAGWTGVDLFTDETEFSATIDLSATSPTSGAGVVQVWVNVAMPSETVYVDSKILVT